MRKFRAPLIQLVKWIGKTTPKNGFAEHLQESQSLGDERFPQSPAGCSLEPLQRLDWKALRYALKLQQSETGLCEVRSERSIYAVQLVYSYAVLVF